MIKQTIKGDVLMDRKIFKARLRVFYKITCALCALMIALGIYVITLCYPEDITAGVLLIVLFGISFILVFSALQMTIQITDTEMIRKILFFSSRIRFKDVKECYMVNGRILSFYMYDGRELKYALYGFEDPEGIYRELCKYIKVVSNF